MSQIIMACRDLEKANFELERRIKVKEWDIEGFRTEIQERD